jgi:hypothetical protein
MYQHCGVKYDWKEIQLWTTQWKAMTVADKAPYEDKSNIDRVRYDAEWAEYSLYRAIGCSEQCRANKT